MAKTFQKLNDMRAERAKQLSKLSDYDLLKTISAYFKRNHTMPGEKQLKDTANQMLAEFDEDTQAVTTLMEPVRAELIRSFADACVKAAPLKYVGVRNDTKRNRKDETAKLPLASDLPMTLCDAVPVQVKDNTVMKNVYEMPGSLNLIETSVYATDKEHNLLKFYLGKITRGVYKNHYSETPIDCTVVATDHSNGKFANMSYTMLVDLCPAL